MKRTGRTNEPIHEQLLLVLLPRSDDAGWRTVLLRRSGTAWSIVAERTEPAAGSGLSDWLATRCPARALVILPAPATIARICSLPPADPVQLASALRLQAETALLGGMPEHRVAMAVLPAMSGATMRNRQGVILAWPESASIPALPELPERIAVRFVPMIGAMLGLAEGRPPEQPLARVDRADGSILLVVGGREGIALRSTREDSNDTTTWRDGIRRSILEPLLAEGRTSEEIRDLESDLDAELDQVSDRSCALVLPPAAVALCRKELPEAIAEDGTIDADLALAAGAILAGDGPLAEIASMQPVKVVEALPALQRILDRLSDPRRIAVILAVAALLFLTAPLASAGVRWVILRAKLPDADQYQRQNRMIQQKIALYRQLADAAWPITKLLGDLSNAMPEGIEVEDLQIGTGDGITIRGLAKGVDRKDAEGATQRIPASDVLLLFERNLRQSGVFSNVDYKWDPEDARGWRGFTLTCQVLRPTLVVTWKEEDDFALTDLRTRRYPNWREIETGGRSGTSAPAAAPDESREESPPPVRTADAAAQIPADDGADATVEADPAARAAANERTALPSDRGIGRRRTPAGEENSNSSTPGGDGRTSVTQPGRQTDVEIPGPFTDDEIRALSRSEAQALLGRISRARQLPGLDPEVTERLKQDFQRVLNQAKSAS